MYFYESKVHGTVPVCGADDRMYEPKPDPDPKPGPDESTNGIPNDFDYSTKASHKLTVKVLDEYEGKRYYTIEVFGSDPITDPNSVFYVGGKTLKESIYC